MRAGGISIRATIYDSNPRFSAPFADASGTLRERPYKDKKYLTEQYWGGFCCEVICEKQNILSKPAPTNGLKAFKS